MSFLLHVTRDALAERIAKHRDLCARGDLSDYDERLRQIGLYAVTLNDLEEQEAEAEARALDVFSAAFNDNARAMP